MATLEGVFKQRVFCGFDGPQPPFRSLAVELGKKYRRR
jgi:hypothetical protein